MHSISDELLFMVYTTDDDHWLVRKKLGPGNIPGTGIKVNLIFVPHFDLKTEQSF